MQIDQFWETFLVNTNRDLKLKYTDSFYFGNNERLANDLLQLVLIGKKRATTSSLQSFIFENIPLPKVGDLCIITNWAKQPCCVIRITKVTNITYNQMTYEICKREGEDDNLASWKTGHLKFFTEDCRRMGCEFSPDMPLLFEDFEVVYINPDITVDQQ